MSSEIATIRPEFLSMLAAGTGNTILPFSKEIFLQEITIAGTGYCDEIDRLSPKLVPNTVLSLKRDPKNKHDELAIEVLFENIRIGWVPRTQNNVVARLMDAGKNLLARVTKTHTESDMWISIECEMYMID